MEGWGRLLEVGVGFHPDLSGLENIYLSGSVIGLGRREMASRINDIVELSGVGELHHYAGTSLLVGYAHSSGFCGGYEYRP